MKQSDLGLNLTTKRTRKREFLAQMERVVPWAALVELVRPYAPEGKKGRPPFAVEAMLRIHFMQQWFTLLEPQYSKAIAVPLRLPTSDTAQLVRAALHGLGAIYKEGFNFAKAGIHLLELEPARVEQKELPLDESPHGRDELMSAMDRINARYGHGALYRASAGTAGARREWTMRRGLKTPEYTTRLADLPVAVL